MALVVSVIHVDVMDVDEFGNLKPVLHVTVIVLQATVLLAMVVALFVTVGTVQAFAETQGNLLHT